MSREFASIFQPQHAAMKVNMGSQSIAEPSDPGRLGAQGHQSSKFAISALYTDSPYPLQHYFEMQHDSCNASLYPGFGPGLTNQPYFVVRQARPVQSSSTYAKAMADKKFKVN